MADSVNIELASGTRAEITSGLQARHGAFVTDETPIPFVLNDGTSKKNLAFEENHDVLIDTMTALRAIPLYSGTPRYTRVAMSGYYAKGDGKAFKNYYWDGTSTATHNGGTVVQPITSPATGRWLAVVEGNKYRTSNFGDATKTSATLNAILSVFPSDNIELEIDGTWTIDADVTIPANVFLKPSQTTLFTQSGTGNQLTFNSRFEGGLYQYFTAVAYNSALDPFIVLNQNLECFPEWWGAKADNSTNCTNAITSAARVDAPDVIFSNGTYICDPIFWGDTTGPGLGNKNFIAKIPGGGSPENIGVKRTMIKCSSAVPTDYFWKVKLAYRFTMTGISLNGNFQASNVFWLVQNINRNYFDYCTFEYATPLTGTNVFLGDESINIQVDFTVFNRCLIGNVEDGIANTTMVTTFAGNGVRMRQTNTIGIRFINCTFQYNKIHVYMNGPSDIVLQENDFLKYSQWCIFVAGLTQYTLDKNYTECSYTKTTLSSYTVTAANSGGELQLTSGADVPTGSHVRFTTTGTLPTGLSLLTTYFVLKISATECRVATTEEGALNSVTVDYTDAGTGTHTMTETFVPLTQATGFLYDECAFSDAGPATVISNNRIQGLYNLISILPNKKFIISNNRIPRASLGIGRILVQAPTTPGIYYNPEITNNSFSSIVSYIADASNVTIQKNNVGSGSLLPDKGLIFGKSVPVGVAGRKFDFQLRKFGFYDNNSGVQSIMQNTYWDGSKFVSIEGGIHSMRMDFNELIGAFKFLATTSVAGSADADLTATLLERVVVDNLGLKVTGRLQGSKGADIASANDLTLGLGNYFDITGTTQINGIAVANWTAGSEITLQFDSTPTVKHNTAGSAGFASILLAGAVDFVASADDTLTLVYDGTTWREKCRTVI
jgi:hypothetical protein